MRWAAARNSNQGTAYLYNSGTIYAGAQAYGYVYTAGTAIAIASQVSGYDGATTVSPGDIYATAITGKYGYALAIGNTTTSPMGDALLYSDGNIYAYAAAVA